MINIDGLKLFRLDEIVSYFEQDGQKLTAVTLRSYIRDGQLKARKCGGQWYVTLDALREFFEYKHNAADEIEPDQVTEHDTPECA
jgi:hypothetical protein